MTFRIAQSIRAWGDTALSFIYPDVCQLCGQERASRAEAYVCRPCRDSVRFIEHPFCHRCGLPFEGDITAEFECSNCREMELHFAAARSAVAARGPVIEAIHRYKYDSQLWFEDFLIELFADKARHWLREQPCHALVPVPLFPVKERERGFNQAERLARRLGRSIGVDVEPRLLKRIVPTPSQTRLSRTERAANMRSAFALRRKRRLKGQSFALIDDVFTTGATTSACAKVLLKAGAERVVVWTVARAEFHG